MEFNPNKTPVEIIKEDAFGGTYFRDIYSSVYGKWYKKVMKWIRSVEKYWSEVLLLKLWLCQCQ